MTRAAFNRLSVGDSVTVKIGREERTGTVTEIHREITAVSGEKYVTVSDDVRPFACLVPSQHRLVSLVRKA